MKKVLWILVCFLIVQNSLFAQTVYDDNYQESIQVQLMNLKKL